MIKTRNGKVVGSIDFDPNTASVVFLRRPAVERVTGLTTSTLYDLIAKKQFPKPVNITPGRVGWIEAEVMAWQQARIAARDSAEAA